MGANPPASTVFRVTFADVCCLCGGVVVVWDETLARCTGFCRLPQPRIEDMTPEQFARMFKTLQRVVAIETASTVEVKGDRL